VTRTEEASSVTLWSDNRRRPRLQPYERHGVKLMSAQLLIGERQALAWQSNLVNLLLHRFFHGVDWGELDLLIVDLPPGTADAQQLVVGLGPTGTVVVVTPQDVAHLDAKKVLTMLREANVPVLGAVENMAWFACPGCGERNELFPPAAAERSIWVDPGVPRLATLPFTPSVSSAGGPIVVTAPESEEAQAFVALARRLSGTRA
jgi:ATP-binding protein involved in chromosome partitioning